MVDQAIALGVDGIIIQHGLTESMKEAAQRAVDAGIKVVAFDVNVENEKIPQIEQSDRDLARLALEQAIKENGESFKAGYVYVAGIAPLDRRDETWKEFKKKYSGIEEAAQFGTMDNPIANSVANQARSVISANPDITVMFAPYDEFAKGVKIAVERRASPPREDLLSRHLDLGHRRHAGGGLGLGGDRGDQSRRRRPGLGAFARHAACRRESRPAGDRAPDADHPEGPQRSGHQEHGRTRREAAAIRACRRRHAGLDAEALITCAARPDGRSARIFNDRGSSGP